MVGAWHALGGTSALDFVTPQIYDDDSAPGYINYPDTHLYNRSVAWLPYVGNNPAKITMGTGSNYSYGGTVQANVTALNNLRAAHPTFRGVVGWSLPTDANAGVPWSFGLQMRAIS